MKTLRLLFAVLALPSLRAAEPVAAESAVTAATVYTDRAVVTRLASSLSLPAGAGEITFSGLPAALVDDSVQVSAKGSAPASLLDISTRVVFTAAEPDPRVKALEDRLADLRRDERALNDQRAVLDSQHALLGNIEKVSTSLVTARAGETPPARPSLEDCEKLLVFSAAQRARLGADARKLDLDRAELAEKIAASQSQLDELRGKQPGRRAHKTVTVRLDAAAAGKFDVTLSYSLPGASWTPAYDARLLSDKRETRLDAFGVVRNATGEDWKNVALTLSTARPGLGGAAPEISPWYVDVSRPVTYGFATGSSMALDREAGSLFGSKKPKRPDPSATLLGGMADGFSNTAMMEQAPAPVAESTLAIAAVSTAATSASFRIAAPVTLASDNAPQRVPLGSAAFPAELQYQATPKLQETAYLAAYVTNRSDLPFLAGSLNVFLDDTFVASSRLATTMPGEKFTLSLGADEGISVKRKIVSRFTEDTGFTTRGRRTTYDILVTVANNKRTAERVVVKDAAPVARDEKILVKLLAPAERELLKPEEAAVQPPKPGISRDADGKLIWRFDLKPGEKREIPLKFSIEHPADLPVTGVE